jgi:hypothetical protein
MVLVVFVIHVVYLFNFSNCIELRYDFQTKKSWDTSVGITTNYGLDTSMIEVAEIEEMKVEETMN